MKNVVFWDVALCGFIIIIIILNWYILDWRGLVVRGPGSIPGATRFSEKWWVWNGSTQPREYNWGVNGVICVAEK
jgi:hypothetical protein